MCLGASGLFVQMHAVCMLFQKTLKNDLSFMRYNETIPYRITTDNLGAKVYMVYR